MNLSQLVKLASATAALAALATLAAQETYNAFQVQLDFFAGMSGDPARLQKAMAAAEAEIARNPSNGSAHVWHGLGVAMASQSLFEKGDMAGAMTTLQNGLAEMAHGVELEPDNIGVRIPRGAALKEIARSMPPEMGAKLLEDARTDYQRAFDIQKNALDQVKKPHPLGELLQGLGDIYSRQGKADEAAQFYAEIQQRLPGTEYATRAGEWMKTRQPLPNERAQCYGCHTGN